MKSICETSCQRSNISFSFLPIYIIKFTSFIQLFVCFSFLAKDISLLVLGLVIHWQAKIFHQECTEKLDRVFTTGKDIYLEGFTKINQNVLILKMIN